MMKSNEAMHLLPLRMRGPASHRLTNRWKHGQTIGPGFPKKKHMDEIHNGASALYCAARRGCSDSVVPKRLSQLPIGVACRWWMITVWTLIQDLRCTPA
jgi:hypothetical protein